MRLFCRIKQNWPFLRKWKEITKRNVKNAYFLCHSSYLDRIPHFKAFHTTFNLSEEWLAEMTFIDLSHRAESGFVISGSWNPGKSERCTEWKWNLMNSPYLIQTAKQWKISVHKSFLAILIKLSLQGHLNVCSDTLRSSQTVRTCKSYESNCQWTLTNRY